MLRVFRRLSFLPPAALGSRFTIRFWLLRLLIAGGTSMPAAPVSLVVAQGPSVQLEGSGDWLAWSLAELSAESEASSPALVSQASFQRELSGDLAWQKGEYRIVPYGIGWVNFAWDSSRTANGAFTLYVESDDVQGESSFTVNARASRFGIDVMGPIIWDAQSLGKLEFDFFGQALVENRASVLLRHAYGEFRTEDWRLLGGQTNDVISPLNPHVLNYTLGWGGGNIGYRRPQLRGERYFRPADAVLLTLQGSINRTIVTDFTADPIAGGEDAGWPTLMGRAALRTGGPQGPELGVSGHIGQEGVDFRTPPLKDDARFDSWSFNVDVSVPIGDRCGFQGEFFVGSVLGTFQGGIIQEIDPVLRRGIASIGGWGEVWFHASDQWHVHAGGGIDDPDNRDLSIGRRSQNFFVFTNLLYHVTELFTVGCELSWWDTQYVGRAAGEALRIESAMQYRF